VADVSNEADVENLLRATLERYGRLDVLVNNAASWAKDGPVTELSEEDWDAAQSSTLKTVFLCSKHAIPAMRAQGAGSIINIASVNAIFGLALAAYTAAKGGVLALTRVMAVMHGAEGIRVNAISPGTIYTESWQPVLEKNPNALTEWKGRYPLHRVGTPDEVAALTAYLASDESGNTTGANYVMDGGLSVGLELPEYGPLRSREG
jgi:3-oxoacyl-[acyl-carrier protein] reductase